MLIVGGGYGSEASTGKTVASRTFYDRYNSITRGEYKSAVARDISTYVLIERSVYAEYETYLRNKGKKNVAYAHVDSVNIFQLIEDIVSQPRNNPIQQFERYSEIESWLQEQWSGLFRELLQRMQAQAQISSLQAQVAQLSEINTTLKRYLEEIVSRVAPKKSRDLIRTETKRLEDASVKSLMAGNALIKYVTGYLDFPEEIVNDAALNATSVDDFIDRIARTSKSPEREAILRRNVLEHARPTAERDFNKLRAILGKPPLQITKGVGGFGPEGPKKPADRAMTSAKGRKKHIKAAT